MAYGFNNPHPEPNLKVLIVRIGAMGDVLHALPAAAALRERLPDCIIGWAIEPRWQGLLAAEGEESAPIVDRIHPVATRAWKRRPFSVATLREIAGMRRELVAGKYDVCVDLQGSIKSAVVGRMAQARHFVGPKQPAEGQAKALYGERIDVKSAHVIEQACELIRGALTDSADPVEVLRPARVLLPVDTAAEAWTDLRLAELDVPSAGFVLLAPTAGWGAKQWPIERYRRLAERLHIAGYRVLVNAGSPDDMAVAQSIGGPTTVVACTIPQLIALTRRARLVVGGDTGPVHLAAALGRPVVGLYGPTDPRRNGPYFPGSKVRVLRHETSRLDHARHANTEAGLGRITEDEVLAAALALLEESSHG